MINACVSHEMRNPIQAILCQNIRINEIVEMINICCSSESSTTNLKSTILKITEDLNKSLNI
jgi:hypothetical protein